MAAEPIWTEPLRVVKAAHRGASLGWSAEGHAQVAEAARQVHARALASGIDLADGQVREAVAWVLLAVTTSPDRDSALSVLVELIAEQADNPMGGT